MSESKRGALSWTPRRNGDIFCAPACGRGCTSAEHKAAVSLAARIVRQLPRGWTARLHENLGWHASAVSPCTLFTVVPSMHGSKVVSYTAYLNDKPGFPGGGKWVGTANTPKDAVLVAMQMLVNDAERLAAVMKAARPSCPR